MNFFKKKAYRFYIKNLEAFSNNSEAVAKVKYKFKNGKLLNLDNPIEFMEKLQWLKFNYYTEAYGMYVDKYEVRSFVEEKIGSSYLNKLIGVYDNVDDINSNELPNQYALKCTHGSGYNVIVENKTQLNWRDVTRKLKKFMNQDYSQLNGERIYKEVKPRIIAEKFLDELAHDNILDYKFYCIHGEPVCIWLKTFDDGKYRSCFYDLNWKKIEDDSNTNSYLEKEITEPENFKEMIKIAKTLSEGFIFIRVDLYSIKSKIYFGELTFFPWGGKKRLTVERFNKELGDLITLPIDEIRTAV